MSKLISFSIFCIFLLQFTCEGFIQISSNDLESFDFIDFDYPYPFLPKLAAEIEDSSLSLSSEEEEDNKQIDSWKKHKHHHHGRMIHLDICKCKNESCSCCVKFLKYKICDNLRLVYPANNSQGLAIDFDITVNNITMLSDEVSLAKLPAFCYRAGIIGVCGKFITKMIECDNEQRVELCADVQLKYNAEVLAHINVFCINVGKKFHLDEDYEEHSEEITSTTPSSNQKKL
ncbi:uncharacterized protein [Halyomorpha halys]|uniref:uncharacterized protein isoform X2 n=1 Tax=Halyomorpha halys TaxID=286706 RepID=UPI000D0C92B5|nr:uncharacterized protein LOC106692999 isoform X2 [Halyomorpha halys]